MKILLKCKNPYQGAMVKSLLESYEVRSEILDSAINRALPSTDDSLPGMRLAVTDEDFRRACDIIEKHYDKKDFVKCFF